MSCIFTFYSPKSYGPFSVISLGIILGCSCFVIHQNEYKRMADVPALHEGDVLQFIEISKGSNCFIFSSISRRKTLLVVKGIAKVFRKYTQTSCFLVFPWVVTCFLFNLRMYNRLSWSQILPIVIHFLFYKILFYL